MILQPIAVSWFAWLSWWTLRYWWTWSFWHCGWWNNTFPIDLGGCIWSHYCFVSIYQAIGPEVALRCWSTDRSSLEIQWLPSAQRRDRWGDMVFWRCLRQIEASSHSKLHLFVGTSTTPFGRRDYLHRRRPQIWGHECPCSRPWSYVQCREVLSSYLARKPLGLPGNWD